MPGRSPSNSEPQPYREEALAIKARNVEFIWDSVPLQYLPGEPFATHFFNVAHVILPEGEAEMARIFTKALPFIDDERLREEVLGFAGQEAMHARSHAGFREHLLALGLDVTPIVRRQRFVLDRILGDRDRDLTGRAEHAWLCERLALYAAAEHFTAVLGKWVLDADHLETRGMHPTMLDLLRWHGAEEMEHRNVAFDVYQHVDGSYARRVRTALLASVSFTFMWFGAARYLYKNDPTIKSGWWFWHLASATVRGVVPSFGFFLIEIPKYLSPRFHPSKMGTLDKALRYLGRSTAARAAA